MRAYGVHTMTLTAAQTGGGPAGSMLKVPMSKHSPGEGQTLHFSSAEKFDGTSRLVIALHGHGADSSQFNQNGGPGKTAVALVRTGRYMVLSIDAGGTASWANATAMARITDAVTWARSIGARPGKYGLLGWSMGGLTAIARALTDAVNIAGGWVWVPALDMQYFARSAGYNAPGNTGVSSDASYAPEITAAYPSGFAGTDPMQNINAYKAVRVGPILLALASDDTVVPPAHADYWLAQINNPAFFQSPKGKVTGGHTMLFGNFTDVEFIGHFDKLTWG